MDSETYSSDFQTKIAERRMNQAAPAAAPEPAPSAPAKTKTAPKASTKDHFNEGLVPAQFKLPRDLVASLKLHSIGSGKSMSEIVLDCLTSDELIAKAWISTKRAA